MLVSVIIPCYNAASYLKPALDSVLCQTHVNIEVLLINDGSTDNTEDIIKGYNDKRIRYFYQPNQGQSAASNRGIREARGEYIKFFDADDIMNRQHIEAQLSVLASEKETLASCTWARLYNDDPTSVQFTDDYNWKDMLPMDWIKAALSHRYDMMPAWFWLIPKNVLDKAGGWDERLTLNNDFEFSIRLLMQARKIKYAKEACIYYRSLSPSSLSSLKSIKAYESAFLSARLGCAYLLKKENTAEMRKLCANKYLFWLYEIYPNYPTLIKQLEEEVGKLGGGDRMIEKRSRIMCLLQNNFGWKTAKRIKLFFYWLGFKKWGSPIKQKISNIFR
jgi:glycosyltransferase involved in cell wall biosynthesis